MYWTMPKIKIGILGYGRLGAFLADQIQAVPAVGAKFELAFIQNRTIDKIRNLDLNLKPLQIIGSEIRTGVDSLNNSGQAIDVILEASHPDVIRQHGAAFLKYSSLFITSLTALADEQVVKELIAVAQEYNNTIYIPTGAGWGFEDVIKMANANTLKSASISMEFHADALKLNEPLASVLEEFKQGDLQTISLYKGPVRELAALAPNNVNTMCGLSLAAHNLGFDGVVGELKATKLDHTHKVYIEIEGPGGYRVKTERLNPAVPGAVTGSMTFQSFLSSLLSIKKTYDEVIQFV